MNKTLDFDEIDKKILAVLLKNANTPYTDIAKQIRVSGGTVHVRMNRLEELGVVVGSSICIDYTKIGFDITAFIGIHLESSTMFESVSEQLKFIPEIVSANYTTGVYGIFAKVICRDTPHLRTVLNDKMQKIVGVQRTETFISLQESFNRPLDIMSID